MFESVAEFLWMGGYAFFVWSAYGITLLVMIANLWFAYRNRQRIVARIQHQLQLQSYSSEPHDKTFRK